MWVPAMATFQGCSHWDAMTAASAGPLPRPPQTLPRSPRPILALGTLVQVCRSAEMQLASSEACSEHNGGTRLPLFPSTRFWVECVLRLDLL